MIAELYFSSEQMVVERNAVSAIAQKVICFWTGDIIFLDHVC